MCDDLWRTTLVKFFICVKNTFEPPLVKRLVNFFVNNLCRIIKIGSLCPIDILDISLLYGFSEHFAFFLWFNCFFLCFLKGSKNRENLDISWRSRYFVKIIAPPENFDFFKWFNCINRHVFRKICYGTLLFITLRVLF